jgi:septal ring factor EnvC (AmiA/AmiB activator)
VSSRLALVLALVLAGGALEAQSPPGSSDAEERLDDVRRRIQELNRRLNETRMKRDKVATELRDAELAQARLVAELAAIDGRIGAQRQRLGDLDVRREHLDQAIGEQRRTLTRFVRATYAMGRQDHFKLLLNQENPATLSRTLTYYAYLNRARSRVIGELATDLRRLADIKESIARDTAELEGLRQQKASAKAELEVERARRQKLVASLAGRLDAQGSRLERLKQDEQKLAELIAGLARELADVPLGDTRQAPFHSLRGKLPWPSGGRLRHRFGTPRGSGDLSWKGVLIAAHPGTPVTAVSHGRVAFADWLRGFGLLMIIEHGDDYMSLYGHNELLFKDVGDWVDAGDLIGKVGSSGGHSSTGLYFEIRHRGKPVDPMRWCGGRPRAQASALVSP